MMNKTDNDSSTSDAVLANANAASIRTLQNAFEQKNKYQIIAFCLRHD